MVAYPALHSSSTTSPVAWARVNGFAATPQVAVHGSEKVREAGPLL